MNHPSKLFSSPFLIAISLLLTACGGGSTTETVNIDTSRPPAYLKSQAKASTSFEPLGEIIETQPTFSWRAVAGATDYTLGYQDSETDTAWYDYTLSADEAGCVIGTQCAFKPDDVTFAIGDKKVWWIKANTQNGWQNWSKPYVFNVTDGGHQPPHSKPLLPTGEIKSISPTFTWTPSSNGATHYKIGMENEITANWTTYTVSENQANCQSAQCSYKPDITTIINNDQHTWWIREQVNGEWQDWSEGAYFSVDTSGTIYTPFENTPNVTSIVKNENKWFALSPSKKEVLEDDGAGNITTVFTAENKVRSLNATITGKIHFIESKRTFTGRIANYTNWLHTLDVKTHASKVLLTKSSINIVNGEMSDFLLVNGLNRASGRRRNPTRYYKVDINSKLIYLGKSLYAHRFSIKSVDTTNNVIHLNLRNGSKLTFKKITDAPDIGLEDELPYVPFESNPNVTNITKANGKWYAISSSQKELLTDDGEHNISAAYNAEDKYLIRKKTQKPLTSTIKNKIFFVEYESYGARKKKIRSKLMSLDLITNKSIKHLSSSIIKIQGFMENYLFVSSRYIAYSNIPQAPRWPLIYYKVDNNAEVIRLGSDLYRVNNITLSSPSVDYTSNEVTFSYKDNASTTGLINKKITAAIGIGLEDM